MKKVITLVIVVLVLGFTLLGQAQGHLFLRIEHGDVALEIGGTEAGSSTSDEPEVHIALFSSYLGKYIDNKWWLVANMEFESHDLADFRNLRDSLSRYLAAPNKGLACIYPPDEYDPDLGLQILGLGNAILIRGTKDEDKASFFVEIKLSLNEAQKVVEALTTALNSMND